MDTLVSFIDQKLSGPMTALANQRHLRAVRDGIVATLPLIIVGSFFLILGNPPLPENWGIYTFLKSNAAQIVLPYRLTMGIMTLYAVFGMGLSLAESYKLDGLSGGLLSTAAFLLTFTPVNVPADANAGISGFVLGMGNMGGAGMFVAIVASIVSVEIYRLCLASGFKISMPAQVPPSVARSFEALIPTAIVVLFFGSITYWFGFNWHGFIASIVAPLISATDSLPSVILLAVLNSFFWVFGIHGSSIVGSVARPIWLQILDINAAAAAAGEALPHIGAEPFFQWFIYIGGSGSTIGLAIAMVFFAKSAYAKSLGKTAIVPSLFNINEPVIFGAPIVLNPLMMIPFMIAPAILATIAWIATTAGLVSPVQIVAPWTLPGPIGAYIATGGDVRASILNIVLIVVSFIVYYPFFKMYDKKLLAEEQNSVE